MFARKASWLISFAQIIIAVNAGFWDNSDTGSNENQTPPSGNVEYGVDMVRFEFLHTFSMLLSNDLSNDGDLKSL